MRILEFQTMIRSEASAHRALRQRRWSDGTRCLRCDSRQLYRLAEGRYRCGHCRYTFGVRTRTWAGQVRVSARTWLWLVKLFELELTASQAAVQTGVSYPTARKAFTTLRRAILATEVPASPFLQREVEADESYFGPRRPRRTRGRPSGRGTPHKVPVFGILERRGTVRVEVVPDCSARTIRDHTLRPGQAREPGLQRQVERVRHAGLLRLSASQGRSRAAVQSRESAHQRARRLLGLR